jgi:superfamily I DNA/RNA helicase
MPNYSAVVVDETQDFGPQALVLLRAMLPAGPNDLFFVGDGHQRIYGRHKAAMSRCGIDIRGRARKLYLNYRTTEEVRLQAVALLEGCDIDDLDEGHDESKLYKSLSHGPAPKTFTATSLEDALAAAWSAAQANRVDGQPDQQQSCCVIASTRAMRDASDRFFRQQGAKTHVIDVNQKDVDDPAAIRLSTMHRAKGLEFDHVVVLAPIAFVGPVDQTQEQRKLLYVALTRARRTAALILV